MTERRVTRNAWSRNKSCLALKRDFEEESTSEEEIEIDLSECIEEVRAKKRCETNEQETMIENEYVSTVIAASSADEEAEKDPKGTEENKKADDVDVGHFLATPVGTCDPKSIWMSRQVGRPKASRYINNPARRRLQELQRVVKLKEKRRISEARKRVTVSLFEIMKICFSLLLRTARIEKKKERQVFTKISAFASTKNSSFFFFFFFLTGNK